MKYSWLIVFALIFYFSLNALDSLGEVVRQWAFRSFCSTGEVICCCTYDNDLLVPLVRCSFINKYGYTQKGMFKLIDGPWVRAEELYDALFEDTFTLLKQDEFVFEDDEGVL